MCMVPMDLHKRRKREEMGLLGEEVAARRVWPCKAELGTPYPAGVIRVPPCPPVKTPFFNDLAAITSLSIRFDSLGNGLHAARGTWRARRL